MDHVENSAARARARGGEVLNKLERIYLSAIRSIALIVATLLIFYAMWLALSGIYKSSGDVSSVTEVPVTVSPEEVIQIDLEKANRAAATKADPLASQKSYYADFATRYHRLFTTKFQTFKKPEDQPLDQKAFDARYLQTANRVERIKDGTLNFPRDRDDLESLLLTMTTASTSGTTVQRLQAYKSAKKIPVTRTVSGKRVETYCSYYGYYVDACLSYDTQTVPFTRTIQESKLPAGVISHTDLFGAYQDRYLSMLDQKRRASAAAAQNQRDAIVNDKADGQARLWTASRIVGGFVILMFLFLLIALERHQRKIAASVAAGGEG